MVAITVILAAVIGTFVLGLGEGLSNAPSAQLDFEYAGESGSQTVTVNHQGGAPLAEGTLSVATSNGSSVSIVDETDDTFTAGDTIVDGASVDDGETIEIVWTAPDGGTTQVLSESTAP